MPLSETNHNYFIGAYAQMRTNALVPTPAFGSIDNLNQATFAIRNDEGVDTLIANNPNKVGMDYLAFFKS